MRTTGGETVHTANSRKSSIAPERILQSGLVMEEGWKFVSRVLVTFYQIHLVERVTTRSQGCFPEGFFHRSKPRAMEESLGNILAFE